MLQNTHALKKFKGNFFLFLFFLLVLILFLLKYIFT